MPTTNRADTLNGNTSLGLASLFRGLYNRVARELGVDPSYVSRVARGERRSEIVQVTLNREMKKILDYARAPFSSGIADSSLSEDLTVPTAAAKKKKIIGVTQGRPKSSGTHRQRTPS